MKIYSILALLLIASMTRAQKKIDCNNYYDYYVNFEDKDKKGILGNSITNDWLRKNEVIPIIIEELQNAGYTWLYDNKLFKITDGQYIVISAYTRKSNFGFLYIEGHNAKPEKNDRNTLTQKNDYGVDYLSYEETISGKPNIIKIEKLPNNIFVLNENCYWYQYTDNNLDAKKLITKEDAIKILRQDIKKNLSIAPKP